MKKAVTVVLIALVLLGLCACSSSKCKVCHGSGYYQKKTCVFCDGSGYSDYDPYEHYKSIG